MKIFITFLWVLFCLNAFTQETDAQYDSVMAAELGADEYGMKSYFLVMLSTGDSIIEDQKVVKEHFQGHLKNIGRLSEEGKLIVAGPLGKNENEYRGIFIFDVNDEKELEEMLQTDPAIKAGLLSFTIYNWYGSAALPTYLETNDKIQKTDF